MGSHLDVVPPPILDNFPDMFHAQEPVDVQPLNPEALVGDGAGRSDASEPFGEASPYQEEVGCGGTSGEVGEPRYTQRKNGTLGSPLREGGLRGRPRKRPHPGPLPDASRVALGSWERVGARVARPMGRAGRSDVSEPFGEASPYQDGGLRGQPRGSGRAALHTEEEWDAWLAPTGGWAAGATQSGTWVAGNQLPHSSFGRSGASHQRPSPKVRTEGTA